MRSLLCRFLALSYIVRCKKAVLDAVCCESPPGLPYSQLAGDLGTLLSLFLQVLHLPPSIKAYPPMVQCFSSSLRTVPHLPVWH